MPVELVDLAKRRQFPSAQQRLAGETRSALLYGNPLERYTADTQFTFENAPWSEAIPAVVNIMGGFDVIGSVHRGLTTDPDIDVTFNPHQEIRDNPKYRDDPQVQLLEERGQFDYSFNWDQFHYDLHRGRRYLADMETYARTGWTAWFLGLGVAMAGAPENWVPFGTAFKAVKTTKTLARFGEMAALMSAMTVGMEKIHNAFQPVSDEPGLSNELAAAGMGAAFGLFGAMITHPPALARVTDMLQSRQVQRMNADLTRMLDQPIFDSFTAEGLARAEGGEKVKYAFKDALANDVKWLQQILDEGSTTRQSLKVLDTAETRPLMDAIAEQYRAANLEPPKFLEHPAQSDFNDLRFIETEITPTLLREAKASDIAGNYAARVVGRVPALYSRLQSHITPAGRLANSTLERTIKALRTMSGSVATHTAATRADPLGNVKGATAEGILGIMESAKEEAVWGVRVAYTDVDRATRKAGLNYKGERAKGFTQFREAVADLLRLRSEVHEWPDTVIPSDVHPSILAAADISRKYWNDALVQIEKSGRMKVGPEAVRQGKLGLAHFANDIEHLKVVGAGRAAQVAELVEARSFSFAALDQRLTKAREALPNALDQKRLILESMPADVAALSDELTESMNMFPVHPDVWKDMTTQQQFAFRQTAGTYGERVVANEDLVTELIDVIGDRLYDQSLDLLFEGTRGSKAAFAEGILKHADTFSPDEVFDAQLYLLRDSAPTDYRTRINKETGKQETYESKGVPRDVVDPMDIPEGTHFTVFGADATVRVDPTDGRQLVIGEITYGIDELAAIPVERESLRGVEVTTKATELGEEFLFHGTAGPLDEIAAGSFFSDLEYARQYAWRKGKSQGKVYAVRKSDLKPTTAEPEDIFGQGEIDAGASVRSSVAHRGVEIPPGTASARQIPTQRSHRSEAARSQTAAAVPEVAEVPRAATAEPARPAWEMPLAEWAEQHRGPRNKAELDAHDARIADLKSRIAGASRAEQDALRAEIDALEFEWSSSVFNQGTMTVGDKTIPAVEHAYRLWRRAKELRAKADTEGAATTLTARESAPEPPEAAAQAKPIPTQAAHRSEAARVNAKVKRLEKRRIVMAENQRKLEETVERIKDYLPTVYNVEAILADQGRTLIPLLAREFRDHDAIVDGRFVTPDERPVLADMMMSDPDKSGFNGGLNLDPDDIRATYGKPAAEGAEPVPVEDILAELTEADLTTIHRERYRAELDGYYSGSAHRAYEHLTDPEESHGVAAALGGQDHLKRRLMTVRYSNLSQFLVNDVETLLNRYHHSVMGRTSISRAIKLNPEWADARLKDGSPVTDGAGIVAYVNDLTEASYRVATLADKELGRTGRAASAPKMARMQERLKADLEIPMKLLEGKTIASRPKPIFSGMAFFGRTMLPIEFMNKLGSVALTQLNDWAPKTMYLLQRPGTLKMIPGIMRGLALGGESVHHEKWRDLKILGITLDMRARVRSITDQIDTHGLGFGFGETRRISGAFEEGVKRASDFAGRLSLMDWVTNVSKQVDAVTLLDRSVTYGKRAYKVNELVDAGDTLEVAMRKARIKRWDLERLNHLGFNRDRTRRYLQLVYQHGLTLDDKPVRLAFPSFADFLNSNKIVKPNFLEWNLKARADIDMLDILAANMNDEVNRFMTVTPGRFDRPLLNARHPLIGNLFNQFQTFGMAFANQRIRPMAQMPMHMQLWYLQQYMLLGGVTDALANHLSGRRSFEETAQLWEEQPLAMIAVGMERSGMLGWWGRPISVMRGTGTKALEPGEWYDTSGTTAARHSQPGKFLTYFGPAAADLDRAWNIFTDTVLNAAPNSNTAYNAWKLAPLQNWLFLRILYSTTGLPVTPESLMQEKYKGRPAKP